MKLHTEDISIATRGRGTIDITHEVQAITQGSGVVVGLTTVFVHHTSASLILCENADPTVRRDLEALLSRIAPDGDPLFDHIDEGPDDMPAHARSVLTATSINIPVRQARCDLGRWQGLYLYEHRSAAHRRKVSVTVFGR